MKISFITTVYNEDSTISDLLQSLLIQSKTPDEIIIVDGGSTDATALLISHLRQGFGGQTNKQIKFKFIIKEGNRAVGRNEAIKNASNEIIICSDAGCILDKDWIKNIIKPFIYPNVDVVAGYYKGNPKSIFEKCLIPYVLVMPDKVDKDKFLPSTRSIAFKKSIWKKTGEFPEEFSNNEDYIFAKRLKQINAKIVFEKEAIVYWRPRNNIVDAFIMFYRFAKGDAESRIFRPKVILVFVRYIAVVIFILLFLIFKSYIVLNTLYLILLTYVFWSIIKNYRYVKNFLAVIFLPLMQLISDIAVIAGTIKGSLIKWSSIYGLF